MGIFSSITHFFSHKSIRIAAVGIEASGKTFLLSDIEATLHKLGYDIQNDSDMRALPISRFNTDAIDANGKVGRTAALGIRPRYVSDVVKMGKNDVEFRIEILDVPGETFAPKQMDLFYRIVTSLTNKRMRKNKIFTEYTYVLGDKKRRVIAYQLNDKAEEGEKPATTSPSQKPAHFGGDDTSDKIEKEQLQSFAEANAELLSRGFKLKEKRLVSCQDVYDNFFEYYGQSFYRAIYDAWYVLEPVDAPKMGEERDNFRQNMRDPFYNLYYCTHATDIVICDKAAIPLCQAEDEAPKPIITKETSPKAGFDASESRKVTTLYENLYTFKTNRQLSNDQNWYIAFKGIDCVIKAPMSQDNLYRSLLPYFTVDGEVNRNAVYSFFTLLLSRKVQLLTSVAGGTVSPLQLGQEQGAASETKVSAPAGKILTKDNFYECVAPFASQQELQEENLYKVYCKCMEDTATLNRFFSDQYQVPNSTGDFFAYVSSRMQPCQNRGMVGQGKDPDGINAWLHIPSHVYFCGTLLDQNMQAHLQTAEQRNVIPEAIHQSSNRFFFGSLQLFCDIFQRNGVSLPSPYDSTGTLMTYYYGH